MSSFRITPIGTCRIHTPLNRAVGRYPIELDLRRNYGFVHTSDEAMQLLKFMVGEKTFTPEVEPLVFRMADPVKLAGETWQPADLHIIEISSAKRLSFGDDVLQSNHLAHHFADFFANRERTRTYWNLVKLGNRRDLKLYLRELPAFRLLSSKDRELLVGLSLEQQSFKAIKSDMAEFVERLGRDKVLFVTHVNGKTEDGSVIPSRDRLIRWVKLAAEQLDVPVFDPTSAMLDFTQELALERSGRDLTHYTTSFADRLFDELHRTHIGALAGMEALGEQGEDARITRIASQLEAILDAGDFIHAAREIHSAVASSPGALPLLELRGLVRSRIGDYEGAVEDFTKRGSDSLLSPALRIARAEAMSATGDHQGALEVAERLIDDEYESAEIYRIAMDAAKQLGRDKEAIPYAKQAYRRDRADLSTALNALEMLANKERPEETAEWRQEILENIADSSSGAFETCLWAIKNRDEELFGATLSQLAVIDKGAVVDLMEDAYRSEMYRAFADAIPVAVAIGRLAPSLGERRSALLGDTVAKARDLFEEGRIEEAYHLARNIEAIPDTAPRQIHRSKLIRDARPLMRDMKAHLRKRIDEGHASGDSNELMRLRTQASDLLLEDPDLASVITRALYVSGAEAEALSLIRDVAAHGAQTMKSLRWTAFLSARSGDLATAIPMYAELSECPDLPDKFKEEISVFFGRAERLALRQLRQDTQHGRTREALDLAELIEQHFGRTAALEREHSRLYRVLRMELKDIEEEDADPSGLEEVLKQIVRLRPDDKSMLRRLALELKKQSRFAESAEYWEILERLDPENESATRNRVQCATLAQRRSSSSGAEPELVG